MVRKIIGGICLFFAVGGMLGSFTQQGSEAVGSCVVAAILCVIGVVLLCIKGKSKEQKAQKKAEAKALRDRQRRSIMAQHVAGLPIAQGTSCVLRFEENHLAISGGGNDFRVSFSKITDLQIKTSAEIQKQYVSSIGGAVGGALLFGPLGAIVGGRAKEKTSKVVEYYFIITYNKNGVIDYVSFQIYDSIKAANIISRYTPLLTGKSVVVDL